MSDGGLVNSLIGWIRLHKRGKAHPEDLKYWLVETGYFNDSAAEYFVNALKILADASDTKRKKSS